MTDLLLLRIAVGLVLNALLAIGAYRFRSVTPGGAAAGVALGTLLFASGGALFWLLMGAFFISSTILSRFKREQKSAAAGLQEKHEVRDAVQVLANGGAALFWALLYLIFPGPQLLTGVVVSFAAANADTWAGEMGTLSSCPPVLITSGAQVSPGRSGGITLLGMAASAAGALFIALLFFVLSLLLPAFPSGNPVGSPVLYALLVTAGGFAGSLIDSLLGATLQAQYTDPVTGEYTERPSSAAGPHTLQRGVAAINNDAVNGLSFFTASFAAVLAVTYLT
jgi:uncharacterized protein (TIGR00297 family)